jgi:hypothetical protein
MESEEHYNSASYGDTICDRMEVGNDSCVGQNHQQLDLKMEQQSHGFNSLRLTGPKQVNIVNTVDNKRNESVNIVNMGVEVNVHSVDSKSVSVKCGCLSKVVMKGDIEGVYNKRLKAVMLEFRAKRKACVPRKEVWIRDAELIKIDRDELSCRERLIVEFFGNPDSKHLQGMGYSSDNAGDGPGRGQLNRIEKDVERIDRKLNKKTRGKKNNAKPRRVEQQQARSAKVQRARQPKQDRSGSNVDKALSNATVAQLDPTACERCSASGLYQPRASQKVSGISKKTVSVASGETLMLAIAPNFANDSTQISIYGYTALTAAVQLNQNLLFGATTPASGAGVFPTGVVQSVTMNTNTPYSYATLNQFDYAVKFVSGNLKIRNKATQMNRAGELYVLQDHHMQLGARFAQSGNSNFALTLPNVYSELTTSSRVAAHPMLTEVNVVVNGSDHLISGQNGGFPGGWTTSNNFCGYSQSNLSWANGVFGNAAISPYRTGGMPIAFVMFSNDSGQFQQFSLEWLEHWEVEGMEIEMMHTPSPSNHNVAAAMTALISSTRSNHAMHPHKSFSEVALHTSKHPAVQTAFKGVENIVLNAVKKAVANKANDTAMTGFAAAMLI